MQSDLKLTALECLALAKDSSNKYRLSTKYDRYCKHFSAIDLPSVSDVASLYPDISDSSFFDKLYAYKEFREHITTVLGSKEEDWCPSAVTPFRLLPYQRFLVNFMSALTPYRGLLLFHGVGAGKTVTAVSIAEGLKETIISNPIIKQKKVLILSLSTAIEGNFRNTMYDPSKHKLERKGDMLPGTLQCTSNSYVVHQNSNVSAITRNLYEEYYEFISRDAFTRHVLGVLKEAESRSLSSPKNSREIAARELAYEYSNRLIIVDEVQNIRDSDSAAVPLDLLDSDRSLEKRKEFRAYDALKEVVRCAKNARLLLLSATPMHDGPAEIVSLLNLLLVNDHRSEIDASTIFDGLDFKPEGRNILRTAATPYISYVRGYNPVSFPTLLEITDKEVRKLYSHNETYKPRCRFSILGDKISRHLQHTVLIKCTMSQFQLTNYADNTEVRSEYARGNVAHNLEKEMCSIVYPSGAFGKDGFDKSFQQVSAQKQLLNASGKFARRSTQWSLSNPKFKYRSSAKAPLNFLKEPLLQNYSTKYSLILANLQKSPGISFVFHELVYVGVLTLAMVLDANGYELASGGTTLLDAQVASNDKICSICNERRGDHTITASHTFRQARYVVLHGDNAPQNQEVVNRLKRQDNVMGEEIKVVLGSKVAREAMDFANVRQIHIASCWFNMSRVEQIIGRGVRNCSHISLPPAERNVVVFRYSSSPGDSLNNRVLSGSNELSTRVFDTETADEYSWRRAEEKDVAIKRVERELKEIAIDCPFATEMNVPTYEKSGSRACDYQQCSFSCQHIPKLGYSSHNYKSVESYKDSLLDRSDQSIVTGAKYVVSSLLRLRTRQTFDELWVSLRKMMNVDKEKTQLLSRALNELLGDDGQIPDLLTAENGPGYIIQRGKHYVFQPLHNLDIRIPVAVRRTSNTAVQSRLALPEPDSRPQSGRHMKDGATEDVLYLLDFVKQTEESRARLLESIVDSWQNKAENAKVAMSVINYFKSFLLYDDAGRVRGHFVTRVPRCRVDGVWRSCDLRDKQEATRRRALSFNKQNTSSLDAQFVAFVDQHNYKTPALKIKDYSIPREYPSNRAGEVKGKTCSLYTKEELESFLEFCGLPILPAEKKADTCRRLVDGFRGLQLKSKDIRYFYNAAEWEALS